MVPFERSSAHERFPLSFSSAMSICAACFWSASSPELADQSVKILFKLDYSLRWHKLVEKTGDDFKEVMIGLSFIDEVSLVLHEDVNRPDSF